VLRSLQQVYGAKKIRGCTIIDAPLFFESAGREEPVDPASRDIEYEGPSPTQGEGNSSIFWGDNQGPVVMVWDGMFPGEQESAKKIISDEDDWIIWRVKPPRVEPKGTKAQRTSESSSSGGSIRRKGWYRTNDIRTVTCCRDMEIWVPKLGRGYSPESIEAIWEAWRNDAPKDECKVQLEGPEKEWWAGTELGLLRAYWFPGHVTASDGSVGTGSMGAGFV
jgi:hypothetical protein